MGHHTDSLSSLQAGSVTVKSPSTDIFDMVPFSPISQQSPTPTRNGTQLPPVPSRSAEISKHSKYISIRAIFWCGFNLSPSVKIT